MKTRCHWAFLGVRARADPYFVELQEHFLAEHCDEFSDDEENKLIYTDVFHDYVCQENSRDMGWGV